MVLVSLNLNNLELTVFITFKMINLASGNQEFINSLIGNTNGNIDAKHITFYRTYKQSRFINFKSTFWFLPGYSKQW